MEKGLTSQLTTSVTATPRQWRATPPSARRSTLSSMGTIMSHTSAATGRLTRATSREASGRIAPGKAWPRATPAAMHASTHTVR